MTAPAMMSDQERIAGLTAIAREVKDCTKCTLGTLGRIQGVPGAGPFNAEVMFIGEGPGFHEDKNGIPFVGPSGKLLEELLRTIGLDRRDVFITNVVRCRPPENRDPLPGEVDTCTKLYLYKQIDILQPKVIATLGRYSMGLFFEKNAKISAINGKVKWDGARAILPLYHPAAVLRNMGLKPQLEAAFKLIPTLVGESRSRGALNNTLNEMLDAGTTGVTVDVKVDTPRPVEVKPPEPKETDKPEAKPTQLSLF